VSRLKQIDARMMDLAREVDGLRAENARLRGALINLLNHSDDCVWFNDDDAVVAKARTALKDRSE